jgi:hypothetical protein
MMLGVMWGMFAAAQRYRPPSGQTVTTPADTIAA